MPRRVLALVGLLWLSPAWAGSPQEALAAALADCRKLGIDQQQNARYLALWTVPPAEREQFLKVLDFHINSLSREAELVRPARVGADLLRVDIRDYGWRRDVYEKLVIDPYFHVRLVTLVDEVEEWGYPDGRGGHTRIFTKPTGRKIRKANVSAAAPWLDAKQMSELIALTQSQAPLLRADWFFAATARQVSLQNKETGAGYYDFLQIKEEKDIESLAGLDRKLAQKVQREIAAIVAESGVALHNRQIFRFGTVSGAYWETLDVENNDDQRNAVRQLDKDFKPDAKEVYFTLPNRLWGLAAVNAADGKLQGTVPDKIAADRNSTSNDLRIHAGKSCITCHVEGLRPIDDWARTFYASPPGDAKLTSPDYEVLKRLRRLYLTPLDDDYQADQAVYARTLRRLTGFTPAELARAYAAVWQRYADTPLSLSQFALELGVTDEELRRRFAAYAKAQGSLDPVLLAYLKRPEIKMRREFIEEAYALGQIALQGAK